MHYARYEMGIDKYPKHKQSLIFNVKSRLSFTGVIFEYGVPYQD